MGQLKPELRAFLDTHRIGVLASATKNGNPASPSSITPARATAC
jgi:hypothetical protein